MPGFDDAAACLNRSCSLSMCFRNFGLYRKQHYPRKDYLNKLDLTKILFLAMIMMASSHH